MKTKKLNGQIALIVLIISAVIMTIGLSVSKRSVVETKITTDDELLKQAFNAAESGVDYFLGTGATNFTASDSRSQASVQVNQVGGGSDTVNLGGITLRNNNNYTWLVGHKADGSIDMATNMGGVTGLTVCVESGFAGAVKVDYFYVNGGNYGVYRAGFNVGVGTVSGYTTPVMGSCSVSGMRSIALNIPVGVTPLLLVVKPIADDTGIAVVASGGPKFPTQAAEISSTGKAGGTTAQVSRKVNVINQYQIPGFMLEPVTAGGSVGSN
jgi:hypothetical protein